MLQIIVFAIFFGCCLAGLGERGKPLLKIFELTGDVMIRLTNVVMYYAPIGVFGLISYTVSKHGLAVLLPLGKLILASFIATALFCIIVYGFLGMEQVAARYKDPWKAAVYCCEHNCAEVKMALSEPDEPLLTND